MMHLTLQDDDAQVLHETLSNVLSDLRMEIADTENKSFRDQLKHREEILEGILSELERTPGTLRGGDFQQPGSTIRP